MNHFSNRANMATSNEINSIPPVNKAPLFSVVVPVYNAENYITRCIDSLLAQKFTDFEILLIDDGSTDHSSQICNDYATKHSQIRVLHQANAGVSTARNAGIDRASGKWVCFVDSDDYVDDNFLAAFAGHGHLEADCLNLQGWKVVSNTNGDILRIYQFPDLLIDQQNINEHISTYRFFDNNTPWAKLFNREVLNRHHIRFRTELTVREDIMFVYTYRQQINKIKLIANTAYCYRQAENRVTLSHKMIHPHSVFLLLREELPPLIKSVLQKFGILETNYARQIYSYNKDKTCISIVKSLYANPVTRKERIAVLRKTFRDKAYFNDPYFTESTTLKIIRRIQTFLSIPAFDLFCCCFLKTYYRHKN